MWQVPAWHAEVVAPDCMACGDTSMQKNSADDMGGRTMYSFGAEYSTDPRCGGAR
jgi:hypothetical protein